MSAAGPLAPSSLSRRSLFRKAGVIALGAAIAPEVLAACSSSSSSSAPAATATSTPAGAALADASIQLNYLENVQFAGTLLALGKGYYQQNGLNVTVLPGGPNVSPEPVVVSGKALVGVTHTAEVASAINNGAPLTIVGAAFQKSPTCMISKASNPLANPSAAANYAVNVYGKDLKLSMAQQVASMKAEKALVSTPDTQKNGLLWLSPEVTTQTIKSLQLGGTKASAAMFSTAVLTQAYKNGIIA